ncbi:mechanosensitive ion channel family protein [Mucisphaera calidilacus]|uniref:Low conductance mechanosensitive channel YnaI n=1 Tax=Mucisphaera calidilacus TaxID=2527982 RepID=A0A518BTQ5_9BACT|nr:mechanosensitive ion channel family protein [Mucisphaera calidilacus]QDU70345.1 Low conductance mechanosensitive channel YnaI [Mucisphaera calidilacus]
MIAAMRYLVLVLAVSLLVPVAAQDFGMDPLLMPPAESAEVPKTSEAGSEPEAAAGGALQASAEDDRAEYLDDARWKVLRDVIEDRAPAWMIEDGALGVAYWQWISVLLFIFGAVVIDYSVQIVLRVAINRLLKEQGAHARRDELRKTLRPFGLTAGALFCLVTLNFLQFDGVVYAIAHGSLAIFTVLTGSVSAWRFIDLVGDVFARYAQNTSTRFDDVLIPLIRKTLKLFVLVLGFVYASTSLGLNPWPIAASLGLGGVAFAFAAKDTVENFFGSLAVLVDRPFDVGDWVVIDGQEGTIESVGFRSTRVRTFYNSQITIPNANLVRAAVDNYGRRRYRRWKTTMGLQYDTPPDKLLAFAEGARELVRQHPFTRKDYYQVWVNEFNASSIDVLLYMFFDVPDWSTELRERERLLVDLVRLADQVGVSFAFPTTTVHLKQDEGDPVYKQHERPKRITDRLAMLQGARAARSIISDQPWRETLPDPVDYGKNDLGLELDAAGNPIEPVETQVSDDPETASEDGVEVGEAGEDTEPRRETL